MIAEETRPAGRPPTLNFPPGSRARRSLRPATRAELRAGHGRIPRAPDALKRGCCDGRLQRGADPADEPTPVAAE